MGQLGKRLAGPDDERLLNELTRAYADEWFAHYNYQFTANALRGYRAPSLTELLKHKSEEALCRANALAERLLEVGGSPIPKLTDLPAHASPKPFKLPDSMSDAEGVLKAVLDAERTGLRTYQKLFEITKDHDPVTQLLVQGYLAAMVRGEEELERLLGDPAPAMTGAA